MGPMPLGNIWGKVILRFNLDGWNWIDHQIHEDLLEPESKTHEEKAVVLRSVKAVQSNSQNPDAPAIKVPTKKSSNVVESGSKKKRKKDGK